MKKILISIICCASLILLLSINVNAQFVYGNNAMSIYNDGSSVYISFDPPNYDSTGYGIRVDPNGVVDFKSSGGSWSDIGSGEKIIEGDTQIECIDAGDGYISITEDGSEIARVTGSNIVIGDTTASGTLDVDQSSSSAAIPVLILDQADVDEDMIKFIGTSTIDNSQTLVDAADLTTPGSIVGWIKVYIQDDAASGDITDGVYYIPFYATPTS